MTAIEIEFSMVRPGRYQVRDRGSGFVYLASTDEILGPMARLLADNGAADSDEIHAYRPGTSSPALIAGVGWARTRTVVENDKVGPRWGKWRPFDRKFT